jgi:hypothetical protein
LMPFVTASALIFVPSCELTRCAVQYWTPLWFSSAKACLLSMETTRAPF